MIIRASVCCIAAFSFWLNVSTACGQVGVNFANYGTGWAEPWYARSSSLSNALYIYVEVCQRSTSTGLAAPVPNMPLAGAGFTAELWGGPEGSSEASLQFLARTTFRTGAAAGLFLSPLNPVPVPFATSGQRVALQLRVYDNQFGSLTSWEQVVQCFCTEIGTSAVFTSEPLGATPVTLQGMGSYCLVAHGVFVRMPVPVLSFSTGGILSAWGMPAPVNFWGPLSPSRSLVAGETVTLKVEVPNLANSVSWRYNGVDLPGQTNQSLVLSNIQPDQSGEYSVRVTVNIGSRVFSRTNIMPLEVVRRPLLEQAARDLAGTFTAQLRGLTNRSVAIESSVDLRNWLRGPEQYVGGHFICTGNMVTNPPLFGPQLFYRAVILP